LSEDILMKKFEPGATIHVEVDPAGEKLNFSASAKAKA
jgi:hypothetical protein